MKIHVDGIHRARAKIASGWPTHIISIVNDSGGEFPATTIDREHDDHYIFSFHDVENDQDSELAAEYVVPTRKDIEDILEVTKDLPADAQVLIHCTAGKSRSTAVALGVLVQSGMESQAAFD